MIQLNTSTHGSKGESIVSKDIKTAKTAAERKADERQRRKDAGQVLIQEWVHESMAAKLKAYAAKLRSK